MSTTRPFKAASWRAILGAMLVILTGSWSADAIKGEALFEGWGIASEYRLLSTVSVVVLFLGCMLLLYQFRRDWSQPRGLSRSLVSAHKSLILTLSPNSCAPIGEVKFPLTIKQKTSSSSASAPKTAVLQGQSLEVDSGNKELADMRWNWQQVLRAVKPHASELIRVCLIGSAGTNGSFGELDKCKALLEHYLQNVYVRTYNKPVDFEDFNQLVETINIIQGEERKAGMKNADMVIDATGGFKTTSIAAASVTLNSEVTFQYVQTSGAKPEVYAYDVVYQPTMSV